MKMNMKVQINQGTEEIEGVSLTLQRSDKNNIIVQAFTSLDAPTQLCTAYWRLRLSFQTVKMALLVWILSVHGNEFLNQQNLVCINQRYSCLWGQDQPMTHLMSTNLQKD